MPHEKRILEVDGWTQSSRGRCWSKSRSLAQKVMTPTENKAHRNGNSRMRPKEPWSNEKGRNPLTSPRSGCALEVLADGSQVDGDVGRWQRSPKSDTLDVTKSGFARCGILRSLDLPNSHWFAGHRHLDYIITPYISGALPWLKNYSRPSADSRTYINNQFRFAVQLLHVLKYRIPLCPRVA